MNTSKEKARKWVEKYKASAKRFVVEYTRTAKDGSGIIKASESYDTQTEATACLKSLDYLGHLIGYVKDSGRIVDSFDDANISSLEEAYIAGLEETYSWVTICESSSISKIGPRIKMLRTLRGLTTAALGKKCGVSAGAISIWERGVVIPDTGRIVKLAEVLGFPVGAFMSKEVRLQVRDR